MAHNLHDWFKKTGYGLLILWVCGISPLIYFGSYSPHRGVQPYAVPVFLQSSRTQELQIALSELAVKQQTEQWLAHRLFAGADLYHPAQTVASVPLSTLYQEFIWVAGYTNPFWNVVSLFSWVVLAVLLGSSAWLPPPEKPPSSFLYSRPL